MAPRTAPVLATQELIGRRRLIVLGLFLVAIFLLGGASREDEVHLIVLRPLAILAGAYALSVARWDQLKEFAVPLGLLALLALWMGLQLVPIPFDCWASLPGRAPYARLQELAGMEPLARPMTLSVEGTLNALMALTIPASVLLLFAVQNNRNRARGLLLVGALSLLSILYGFVQYALPSGDSLHLYRISSDGFPVGLFANRNHNAVVGGMMLLGLAWYFSTLTRRSPWLALKVATAVGFAVILFMHGFIAASRAGLVITGVSVIASFLFIKDAALLKGEGTRRSRSKKASPGARWRKYIVPAGYVVGLILVLGVIFATQQTQALDRLIQGDPLEENRGQVLPVLWEMTRAMLPLGSGFGSFEFAFRAFEPVEMLQPKYFNEAHNDLLQWVIEGGIPALLIAAAFGLWIAAKGLAAFRSSDTPNPQAGGSLGFRLSDAGLHKLAIIMILQLVLASAVDYPLRTPIMMVWLAVLAVILASKHKARALPRPSSAAFERTG